MHNLEKFVFLVVMGGTLLFCRLRARRRARTGQTEDELVLQIVIAATLVFVAIGSLVVFWTWFREPSFLLPKIYGIIKSPLLIQIPVAALAGLVLHQCYKYLQSYEEKSATLVIAYGLPFVFLFTIGFFRTELNQGVQRIVSVKAPYIDLVFERPDEPERVRLSGGAESKSYEYPTHFVAGVNILDELLKKAATDQTWVEAFCVPNSVFRCADDKASRPVSNGDEGTGSQGSTIASLNSVRTILINQLRPFSNCLIKYSTIYENGVPLQDELSELAVSYATSLARNGNIKTDIVDNSNNRLTHLKNFLDHLIDSSDSSCSELSDFSPIGINSAIDRVILYSPDDIILSVFGASILLSAGYPVEAGSHLDRIYKQVVCNFRENQKTLCSTDSRNIDINDNIEISGFREFVIRIRFTSFLEQIFAQANLRDIQIRYLRHLDLITSKFFEITRIGDSTNIFLTAEECSDDGFRSRLTTSQLSKGVIDIDTYFSYIDTKYIPQNYFRGLFRTLLFNKTRLFDAIFFLPSHRTSIHDVYLARNISKLALYDGDLLSSCFISISDSNISKLKFYILSTSAYILIKYSEQDLLSPLSGFSNNASIIQSEYLCDARDLLFHSLAFADGIRSSPRKAIIADISIVERILRRLEGSQQLNCST